MSCARSAYRYFGRYVHNESILDSLNGESKEWLGNGSLAIRDADKITDQARTLMFFDSAPRNKNESHSGVRVTTAADTSARAVQESLFQRAVVNHWVIPEPKR
jgi:hypothetical protein